jgi:imidazolonepropionase-like amidohydrolase
MILSSFLFALLPAAPAVSAAPAADLLAIRVGRAETVSKGVIEHAVILVEGGKIVTIGEDLPVERGIRVLDKPGWVVIPGLVNAYSRLGLDSEGTDDSNPEVKASGELYPGAEEYAEVVKHGVTTLGLYPAGNGIPGQAVAVRPAGATAAEMTLADPAYLKVILRANSRSKKMLTDGFKKADEHAEKEKKAREKWDKDQEKKKKAPAKKDEKPEDKKEEEKKEEKKDEPKSAESLALQEAPKKPEAAAETFVPPEPDPKAKPFLDLRAGKLRALVSVDGSAEYLHLLDALGKETIDWSLRVPVSRELDLFYVFDKKTYDLEVDGIGDKKLRVVLEPVLTVMPGTMRTRNPAAELVRAGAKLVLIPRNDTLKDHEMWLAQVGEVVGAGLGHDVALRAITLEAAELLGVSERLGSLDKGKDANMVFLDGDPFEPATRIQAVMLDGRFVFGEAKL